MKSDLKDESRNHCMKALNFKAKENGLDLTASGTQ